MNNFLLYSHYSTVCGHYFYPIDIPTNWLNTLYTTEHTIIKYTYNG